MDKISHFQVAHGRSNLSRYVHQNDLGHFLAVGIPEVIEKIAPKENPIEIFISSFFISLIYKWLFGP